jgi:hypothetical protein
MTPADPLLRITRAVLAWQHVRKRRDALPLTAAMPAIAEANAEVDAANLEISAAMDDARAAGFSWDAIYDADAAASAYGIHWVRG